MTTRSLMSVDTDEAPEAARIQIAATRQRIADLGARLRNHPPTQIVTCARGSSDHAAKFGKYVIETTLGRVVASVGPSICGRFGP